MLENWLRTIRRWERRTIPKLRTNLVYLVLTRLLLSPLILVIKLSKQSRPKQLIQHLQNIKDGWFHYATNADPEVEALAIKRAEICVQCPNITQSNTLHILTNEKGDTKAIKGMLCGICKCPLSAKVRSIHDSCPQGRW